jgi:hypothetical protein
LALTVVVVSVITKDAMAAAGTVPEQEASAASAASEVVIVDETAVMPVVGLYLKRTKANGQPALEFFV